MEDVKFTKVRGVKTPTRATKFAAGIDLFVPEDFATVTLNHGDSVLIPSGLKFLIPASYALVANNKSGVAVKKGLTFGAAVIDSDYHGEAHIHLIKSTSGSTTIVAGEKIVQFLLEKQEYSTLTEVATETELYADVDSDRGDRGFGSTGVS